MTQNATFKVFTVSELLRKNHQGRAGGQNTPPPRLVWKQRKILSGKWMGEWVIWNSRGS